MFPLSASQGKSKKKYLKESVPSVYNIRILDDASLGPPYLYHVFTMLNCKEAWVNTRTN